VQKGEDVEDVEDGSCRKRKRFNWQRRKAL
jgi:hypothetical protein